MCFADGIAITARTKATVKTAAANAKGAPGQYHFPFGSMVTSNTVEKSAGPIIPEMPLSELLAPDSWPCWLGSIRFDIKPWIDALKKPINEKITVEIKNCCPVVTVA